jgi:hypothetical protein
MSTKYRGSAAVNHPFFVDFMKKYQNDGSVTTKVKNTSKNEAREVISLKGL